MDPNEIIPIYTVQREDGVVCRINQRDYDPAIHTIVDGAPAPAPASKPEQTVVAPSLGVSKIGRKFFVVDLADGKPVELDGIDAEGYKSDTDAIAAAQKVIANA